MLIALRTYNRRDECVRKGEAIPEDKYSPLITSLLIKEGFIGEDTTTKKPAKPAKVVEVEVHGFNQEALDEATKNSPVIDTEVQMTSELPKHVHRNASLKEK